ncbi:MAG: hypothetical protein ACI8PP_002346 [Candidatus Pseudothioglobus sp.]|jgi:hypothetical protein
MPATSTLMNVSQRRGPDSAAALVPDNTYHNAFDGKVLRA